MFKDFATVIEILDTYIFRAGMQYRVINEGNDFKSTTTSRFNSTIIMFTFVFTSIVITLVILIQLAWPFTILQNDIITISWDYLRLTAPAVMPGQLGAVILKLSHDIVILSFCNIVKGQAKYKEFFFIYSNLTLE